LSVKSSTRIFFLSVKMKLSVIIPIYNESEIISELNRRLEKILELFNSEIALTRNEVEFIFINDGSRDDSFSQLLSLVHTNPCYKLINFSRNFGHQKAVTAGLHHAKGEHVVIIDADLQDPPEFIVDLYKKQQEGFDVVYAVRKKRNGENFFKKITAKLFYRLLYKVTDIDIPFDTGDFRIMNRKVVDVLNSMPEAHRFIRGMVSWVGFKQIGLEYERQERFAGQTKYPLKKMLRFAFDAITSFSTLPLKLMIYLGFLASFFGILGAGYVMYIKFFTDKTVTGWSSIMIVILLMGGVQLLTIGIMGEYVGRISEESKKRPLYIIEKIYEGGNK
jgi:glycosyltransferase involved in cell wall biosynthesis